LAPAFCMTSGISAWLSKNSRKASSGDRRGRLLVTRRQRTTVSRRLLGCLRTAGAAGAEAGEDVQGVVPVLSGPVMLIECVVGVGKAVVSAGLVCGLGEVGGVLKRLLMVDQRDVGVARAVMEPAQAKQRLELPVAAAGLMGEFEHALVAVGALFMPARHPVNVRQTGQGP